MPFVDDIFIISLCFQAVMARDALAKALYSHLFDYVVKVRVYSFTCILFQWSPVQPGPKSVFGSHLQPFILRNRNYNR